MSLLWKVHCWRFTVTVQGILFIQDWIHICIKKYHTPSSSPLVYIPRFAGIKSHQNGTMYQEGPLRESVLRMRKPAIRAIAKARVQCAVPALQRNVPSAISCYAFVPAPRKGEFRALANARRACPLAKRAVRELVLRICSSTTKSMRISSTRKRAYLRRARPSAKCAVRELF